MFSTLSSSVRLAVFLLAFNLVGCAQSPVQSPQPFTLHLTKTPVAVDTHEIDYLTVDSKVFKATVYQPQGPGPFPVILDVHGGAWVREDVSRTEHAADRKSVV